MDEIINNNRSWIHKQQFIYVNGMLIIVVTLQRPIHYIVIFKANGGVWTIILLTIVCYSVHAN